MEFSDYFYYIFRLLLLSLVPIGASVGIFLLDTRTGFAKLSYWKKQIVIGILFGIVSIITSEFGIDTGSAVLNIRDSAPICAGLLFGGPAGIIAGVIGATERGLAVLWGASSMTVVACVVATLLAGLLAAFLRKFLFDNKMPTIILSGITAFVIEVLHLTIAFITNINYSYEIYNVLNQVSVPMIIGNVFAVTFSTIFIFLIAGKNNNKYSRTRFSKISKRIEGLMIGFVVVIIVATEFVDFFVLYRINAAETEIDMKIEMRDTENQIHNYITSGTEEFIVSAYDAVSTGAATKEELYEYYVTSVVTVDSEGIITDSTIPEDKGQNIDNTEHYSCLRNVINKPGEVLCEYQEPSEDKEGYLTVGLGLDNGGAFSLYYDEDSINREIRDVMTTLSYYKHIHENGFLIVTDENGNIISNLLERSEQTLDDFNIDYVYSDRNYLGFDDGKMYIVRFDDALSESDEKSMAFMYVDNIFSYKVIEFIPYEEAITGKQIESYINLNITILLFALLFMFLYLLIKHIIKKNVADINATLDKIVKGNYDRYEKDDKFEDQKFSSISEDISRTVGRLQEYTDITIRKQDEELEFAKSIQAGTLPHDIEPFVDDKPFEVYATMDTAKEVGGDFYDHFFIDDNKLAFLVADVSGKGIPAAMFMMNAKNVIRAYVESGYRVDEALTKANKTLCDGNGGDLFVTAWIGVLDIESGVLEYVNAGHNKPLLRKGDGDYEYVGGQPNLFLATMPDIMYRRRKIRMAYGDSLFLYTDGVTEADNADRELYGEKRLQEVLNRNKDKDMRTLLYEVKEDVVRFVDGNSQFDDMTMLGLYYGKPK